MKSFAKTAVSVSALAAAIVGIGLLSPRPLASQYASPVNVMNSKAAPANIRDVDSRARTPYVSTASGGTCNPTCGFTNVPANMRLVITHVDGIIIMPSSQGLVDILLSRQGSADKAFPAFTATAPVSGFSTYIVSAPVEYYVDAGGLPTLDVQGTAGSVIPGSMTLTGYLIDCTNGCSAIVH